VLGFGWCGYIDSSIEGVISRTSYSGDRGRKLGVSIRPDETLDGPLEGELRIIQKREGYRYSIDALLLSNFCRLKKGDIVVDLGTGNAIIPILLATRNVTNQFFGVEIQQELIEMAHRSVAINNMEGRINLIHCDVRDLERRLEKASFDVAISNPPYRPVQAGRVNPHPQKALARHEIRGSLKDMARIASFLLRSMGRFYVIYPASRTVDMVILLRESDLEPKRIQMVHANAKEDAKLVMAEAVKGGRREVKILKPFFVYGLKGGYTAEMKKIYSSIKAPGSSGCQGSEVKGQEKRA
jgi:tRNA1Val (adenine37-N6)-methyltransferase